MGWVGGNHMIDVGIFIHNVFSTSQCLCAAMLWLSEFRSVVLSCLHFLA